VELDFEIYRNDISILFQQGSATIQKTGPSDFTVITPVPEPENGVVKHNKTFL